VLDDGLLVGLGDPRAIGLAHRERVACAAGDGQHVRPEHAHADPKESASDLGQQAGVILRFDAEQIAITIAAEEDIGLRACAGSLGLPAAPLQHRQIGFAFQE